MKNLTKFMCFTLAQACFPKDNGKQSEVSPNC